MKWSGGSRPLHAALVAAVVLTPFIGPAVSPAAAQAAGCEKIKSFLDERKSIVTRLNKLGKRPDAKAACGLFTTLVNNGSTTLKWVDSNKDWCQIPDQFVNGFKADNAKAASFKGKACQAAAQQASAEKRAREQPASPFNVPRGGDILTGPMQIPKSAL
jgi:hypothetical protein